MKNSILKIAIIFGVLSISLSACEKDDNDNSSNTDQDTTESSFTLTIDGITSTEVVGEISVCSDGYFNIIGKAPDGSNISLSTSKIMENETRSICDFQLEPADYDNCIDNQGFSIGGTIFAHHYSSISGTATRSSTNDITITGVLMQIDDISEHAFTLEATASLVSPVNCE